MTTLLSSLSFAQSSDAELNRSQLLLEKGIASIENLESLSDEEFEKIIQFSFDSYRSMNDQVLIMVNRGPNIQLESLNTLKSLNIQYDENVYTKKESENSNLRALSYKLELGFGSITTTTEKWQSK